MSEVKSSRPRKKAASEQTKTAGSKGGKAELQPRDHAATELLPRRKQSSLIEWCNLYLGIEGRAGSDNTFKAKRRDLESFLNFLQKSAGTDHPDQWTPSVTRDFLKHLERKEQKSPTTINRMLATLRHCSTWIESQREFLAGPPCDRIDDLELDDPEWKGLDVIEITRLKSAAEQLIHIQTRANRIRCATSRCSWCCCIAWMNPQGGPGMSSSITYEGYVYIPGRNGGIVTCVDVQTGEPVYRERLPNGGQFWASPWAYGGKVFLPDANGTTHVIEPGPELKVVGSNQLEGRFWATSAMANGRLFLRSQDTLYTVARQRFTVAKRPNGASEKIR